MLTLLMLLALPCAARDVVFSKPVDEGKLHAELKAAGFKVIGVNRLGAKQWVMLEDGEAKDPAAVIAAHVYVDPKVARQALLDELEALEAKLDDESATLTDLRRISKIRLKLDGLAKRP